MNIKEVRSTSPILKMMLNGCLLVYRHRKKQLNVDIIKFELKTKNIIIFFKALLRILKYSVIHLLSLFLKSVSFDKNLENS